MSEYLSSRTDIVTSIFELFKTGPGPSSSHTMAPMAAAYDFYKICKQLDSSIINKAHKFEVMLLGSLSATGKGHGTDIAVIAGLLGNQPASCHHDLLSQIQHSNQDYTVRLNDKILNLNLNDVKYGSIITDKDFSNTLICYLLDTDSNILFEKEYYSVGGGFIQWKGWKAKECGKPKYPYGTMHHLLEHVENTGLTLHEIVLDNESAITGMSRPKIYEKLEQIMEAMCVSVENGLKNEGFLPGDLYVTRKAKSVLKSAEKKPHAIDKFLGRLNAYAFATSEENAAGGTIVTAPTCGSAGVMASILYAMRHNLHIGDRALREGFLASAVVGFLAKNNAGIAGAEVGCQGEVGVACAMAAAMLAHTKGYCAKIVENAAEIALEHHLGLTCDPIGGYVQIPCIERNAVGAVKAYNACLLATCEPEDSHQVSLDAVILAMAETGREMCSKYKETSEGGLAVSIVEC